MTVLGALFSERANLNDPQLPLTSVALAEWLGGERVAGVAVNERTAYGLTAWYRAVALISGAAAGLPLKVYMRDSRTPMRSQTVVSNPNPTMTPFEFWQVMYAHALSWGNAFALKSRDGAGIVRQLWPVHPSFVQVELVTDGTARRYQITESSGRQRMVVADDMFHLPYLSLDGRQGLAPLTIARQTLGIGIAAERTASRLYANGMRTPGILQSKHRLTDATAQALKLRWKERNTGPENVGDIAVLDNETEFKPIALPPADAELLASRKFTATEVARLFGIPPHMLGDVEKSTSWGSGIEQQMIGFEQFTLKPWLQLVEQRVTFDLLPGGWGAGRQYAEYNLEGLLRGDSTSRAAFYHQAITDGWLSRNEVRSKENLEPAPGGDEFLVPSNLTLVSVDGNLVPLSAKGMNQ